jgi:hypothetical protein
MNNTLFEKDEIDIAIELRNKNWYDNNNIPNWVNINNVGLDQFFTKNDIALHYYNSLLSFLKRKNIDINNCVFIEPSAGAGSFFGLLPEDKSIGLDIYPMAKNIIQQDFLSWEPPIEIKNKIKIFIGNPPFGYRGWLALSFMNHASKFADYIGFILPMSFQSDGKGSPKNRVKNMKLEFSETLPADSFVNPSGKTEKVNALWQIWEKGENIIIDKPTCNEWVDIFTVDLRKERLCGVEKMSNADYFLQRTFYNHPPKLVTSFSDVKYVCGYGLIIKKEKAVVENLLNNANWSVYSNLAAHNCRHISMYHIEKVLTDNKFIDGLL